MNRSTIFLAALAAMTSFTPACADPAPDAETVRCAQIVVSKPVKFHGKTLKELPDIHEPALRLANQLLSSDCYERADQVFQAFVKKNSGKVHSNYYLARRAWMTHSAERARDILETTLAMAPDFASAKVLLAGLEYSEGNLDRTRQLLDEAEAVSSEDVWIYINRSRLAAMDNPTPELRARMMEMARSEAFPPNVRAYAADISKYLPGQNASDYEESLRAAAAIRSPFTACEMASLAMHLGEGQGRFSAVRELLESPAAQEGDCLGLMQNRVMLAQAYLMEAAAIHPQPVSRNYDLVVKANQLMGDDYLELVNWVAGRPQAEVLRPFLRTKAHPDGKDHLGVTSICHALEARDAKLVRAYLDDGANPQGPCREMPLMHRLTYFADGVRVSDVQGVAQALLEFGAKPVIEPCETNDNSPFCSRDLLPIFEKHGR
jgi:tetratricopeptide (TPR) repeat protein